MVTEVTDGIKISVETAYQPSHSDPKESIYLFSYRVVIENCSDQAVKLLRRHWWIHDANGMMREVEGKGVVGEQPILKPGEKHCYSSTCDLPTEIGKMKGTYLMERVLTGSQFYVNVPEFSMAVLHILN